GSTGMPGDFFAADTPSLPLAPYPEAPIVDTNVYLSRWPFRRLPCDQPQPLAARLRLRGVARAWTGSFDGLLHDDLAAVNDSLAQTCRATDGELFVPFGSVNPSLPGWQDDLLRCHEIHQMPGIRLHPGYQGWNLDDPAFEDLLRAAAERELLIQIVVRMEDSRTQHPLLQAPDLDLTPLAATLERIPGCRIQLLNALRTLREPAALNQLAALGVGFEIAMLEGAAGIEHFLEEIPLESLLFGSYTPFFYLESALLKLPESALDTAQLQAICSANAAHILSPPV
ncbi:MAG: amidohydrolase family protein, partial [Verrucomicrobiales bacterium]